jgi:hypothetical protein
MAPDLEDHETDVPTAECSVCGGAIGRDEPRRFDQYGQCEHVDCVMGEVQARAGTSDRPRWNGI